MARRESQLSKETKEVAALYGIKPQHKFGQNFLINELVYADIIDSADLKPTDRILEIGPGIGILTMMLADNVKEVHAVEIDKKIARILPKRLAEFEYKNIFVHEGNILDFPNIKGLEDFDKEPYKIVANLPYNITSVFLRKFLERENRPESLTLMLQKEVAERICAKPGKLSILALSVQFYAEVEYQFTVEKSSFWPEPEVRSAVVNIKKRQAPQLSPEDRKSFWRLVKVGFSAKRKMLKKNLANAFSLDPEDFGRILKLKGLNPDARAQDLSLDDWLKLFALLKKDVL